MKVGIYDPYFDAPGGGEKYMLTVAQCLSKEHAVEIFWNEKGDIDNIEEKFDLDLSNVKVVDNIFGQGIQTFKRILQTRNYDAIIFLSDGSIPFSLSKKLILHFQFPVEWVENDIKTKFKMSRVNSVICNSYFTKKYIDEKFGILGKVIYPPADVVKKPSLEKQNIILHVGRFAVSKIEGSDYKKQEIMIKVFKELVDEGLKNWRFRIIVSLLERDIKTFENLKSKVKGYPIEFLINISRKEVMKEYALAKIYWHASGYGEDLQKNPEKAEHFGIAVVEAMSQGAVPVIINAGGLKEIVQHGNNGFLWHTTEELKNFSLQIIKSDRLFEKLSNAASKNLDKFGINRFCEEINKIVTL